MKKSIRLFSLLMALVMVFSVSATVFATPEEETAEEPVVVSKAITEIANPEAKIYDRYKVFQADSLPAMVAGDPILDKVPGGVMSMLGSAFGGGSTEGRQRQLPAVLAVAPDMTVKYAYYGKTLSDMPDLQDAIGALLK